MYAYVSPLLYGVINDKSTPSGFSSMANLSVSLGYIDTIAYPLSLVETSNLDLCYNTAVGIANLEGILPPYPISGIRTLDA